eukprot:1751450-Amphidinium_carterae.1
MTTCPSPRSWVAAHCFRADGVGTTRPRQTYSWQSPLRLAHALYNAMGLMRWLLLLRSMIILGSTGISSLTWTLAYCSLLKLHSVAWRTKGRTKVSICMTKSMVKAASSGQMDEATMDSGRTAAGYHH